jgi:hypothetical protein
MEENEQISPYRACPWMILERQLRIRRDLRAGAPLAQADLVKRIPELRL